MSEPNPSLQIAMALADIMDWLPTVPAIRRQRLADRMAYDMAGWRDYIVRHRFDPPDSPLAKDDDAAAR